MESGKLKSWNMMLGRLLVIINLSGVHILISSIPLARMSKEHLIAPRN